MVLRIIIFMITSVGFLQAQDLFYTDSYQTNIYQHSEELFVFNNDVFSLMDDSTAKVINILLEAYFREIKVSAQKTTSSNSSQIRFTYQGANFQGLEWSKTWNQKYAPQMSQELRLFLNRYFDGRIEIPQSVADAALLKHAYYNLRMFRERISDFTRTSLQITVAQIDQEEFKNKYLEPNHSLNRLVTKSFGNYFNESYPVLSLETSKSFIFGPSSQARLKDCLSLYFYTKLNPDASFVFLRDNTILIQDSLQSKVISEELVKLYKPIIKQDFIRDVNSLDICFYNIADKRNIMKLFEEYTKEDFEDFIDIYINQNSYNYALPSNSLSETFNKQVLEEKVFFKVNDTSFVQSSEMMIINGIANFLLHNPQEQLLILAYAGTVEYEKIDKKALNKIINKYKEYPPVETSKSQDLSIYRAVYLFDILAEKGVHPSRMSCLSKIKAGDSLDQYAYGKFVLR